MVVKPLALNEWREELERLQDRLGELFVRLEPRRQAGLYLEALLSSTERKNGWQLAEQIGDARPWRTQRVLSHVLWSQDKARALAIHQFSRKVVDVTRRCVIEGFRLWWNLDSDRGRPQAHRG